MAASISRLNGCLRLLPGPLVGFPADEFLCMKSFPFRRLCAKLATPRADELDIVDIRLRLSRPFEGVRQRKCWNIALVVGVVLVVVDIVVVVGVLVVAVVVDVAVVVVFVVDIVVVAIVATVFGIVIDAVDGVDVVVVSVVVDVVAFVGAFPCFPYSGIASTVNETTRGQLRATYPDIHTLSLTFGLPAQATACS